MTMRAGGYVAALAATALFVSAGGVLVWGGDLMVVVLLERMLEHLGILSSNWGRDHFALLVDISLAVAAVMMVALFVILLRRALARERELADGV